MIFDEVEAAESLLNKKDLEYFSVKDMTLLSKYFKNKGQSWVDVKNSLIEFCNSQKYISLEDCDKKFLDNGIKNAKKYKIREPKLCVITKKELEEIETLDNFKTERIYFVMICLAKYFSETNTAIKQKEYANYRLIFWRTTSELFKQARYNDGFFDRNLLIGDIEDLGYIKTEPNKDRTKNFIIINTYYPESEPTIFFDNPDKIYKLYKAYKDNKLIRCSECGLSTIKNSNRQSMCEKCWKEKNKEQTKNRVRKFREKNVTL